MKLLSKKHEAAKMVALRFGHYDVAMKTDEEDNPMPAFVGKPMNGALSKGSSTPGAY